MSLPEQNQLHPDTFCETVPMPVMKKKGIRIIRYWNGAWHRLILRKRTRCATWKYRWILQLVFKLNLLPPFRRSLSKSFRRRACPRSLHRNDISSSSCTSCRSTSSQGILLLLLWCVWRACIVSLYLFGLLSDKKVVRKVVSIEFRETVGTPSSWLVFSSVVRLFQSHANSVARAVIRPSNKFFRVVVVLYPDSVKWQYQEMKVLSWLLNVRSVKDLRVRSPISHVMIYVGSNAFLSVRTRPSLHSRHIKYF